MSGITQKTVDNLARLIGDRDMLIDEIKAENDLFQAQLTEATARVGEMQKAILEYHQAVFNQDLSAEAMDRKAKTRHALFLLLHDNDL